MSLGLVLILSQEWSFDLKVQFFFRNKLQVVVRELVMLSSLGGSNVVSQSGGSSGVGSISSLDISGLSSLELLLLSNHSRGLGSVDGERFVSLIVVNVRHGLWKTCVS